MVVGFPGGRGRTGRSNGGWSPRDSRFRGNNSRLTLQKFPVEAATGIRPGETMFVSSNGFDVAGAKRFGFQVAWVRRRGAADIRVDEPGPTAMFKAQRLHAEILRADPDHVVSSLLEVAELR